MSHRNVPRIVVFLAIAAAVGAIYWREWGSQPAAGPGIIYVNPNLGSGNP